MKPHERADALEIFEVLARRQQPGYRRRIFGFQAFVAPIQRPRLANGIGCRTKLLEQRLHLRVGHVRAIRDECVCPVEVRVREQALEKRTIGVL